MGLPERQREIVVEKLATLESTPIEVVETLGEVLSAKVGDKVSRALNQTGGEKSAAAVLNAMSKDERKKLLDNIDGLRLPHFRNVHQHTKFAFNCSSSVIELHVDPSQRQVT